jgi:hypothetical protein
MGNHHSPEDNHRHQDIVHYLSNIIKHYENDKIEIIHYKESLNPKTSNLLRIIIKSSTNKIIFSTHDKFHCYNHMLEKALIVVVSNFNLTYKYEKEPLYTEEGKLYVLVKQ